MFKCVIFPIFRIGEGTVLLLRKFKSKKGFSALPRFKNVLNNLPLFDIDVNLNSHNPESEVRFLDESLLPDSIQLPDLQHNFVTRKLLG